MARIRASVDLTIIPNQITLVLRNPVDMPEQAVVWFTTVCRSNSSRSYLPLLQVSKAGWVPSNDSSAYRPGPWRCAMTDFGFAVQARLFLPCGHLFHRRGFRVFIVFFAVLNIRRRRSARSSRRAGPDSCGRLSSRFQPDAMLRQNDRGFAVLWQSPGAHRDFNRSFPTGGAARQLEIVNDSTSKAMRPFQSSRTGGGCEIGRAACRR
jgi:hypothetical protein